MSPSLFQNAVGPYCGTGGSRGSPVSRRPPLAQASGGVPGGSPGELG